MHFSKYRILFIFILGVLASNAKAQDTLNSAGVEQKSYQLYQDKNWSELIKYGNMVVGKGIDYFYLQLRIGIAYYEKKNYLLAEGHFKKALTFNSGDELTQEYLYYCYVFTGRYEQARMFSRKFDDTLAKKTGVNLISPVGFVMIEGGTKITDSVSYYNAHQPSVPNYFNPATYFQFGLNHYVKNRVSVFHAVTYYNQQNFLGTNRQLQYYLKLSIPLKKNWMIIPAFDWINKRNTTESKPPPPNPMHFGPPPRSIPIITKSNNFVGSLEIQKAIKKFKLSLGTTVASWDSYTQFIHSGSLSYSVFGNSRLIFGATGYAHTINSYSTINSSVSPFIFIQPIERISITASYLSNNGNNIIEENGYLVNNSPDLTTSRWSVLASFNVGKHIALYGLYQLEYKQEAVQLFNYHYNVFVAGIKITP